MNVDPQHDQAGGGPDDELTDEQEADGRYALCRNCERDHDGQGEDDLPDVPWGEAAKRPDDDDITLDEIDVVRVKPETNVAVVIGPERRSRDLEGPLTLVDGEHPAAGGPHLLKGRLLDGQ